MADIDVERKRTNPWIWAILGLVALGLIVLLLVPGMDRDPLVVDQPPVTEPMPPAIPTDVDPLMRPAEVQEYQQACAPAQPTDMGVDHQYTSECLRRLVVAVEATVPQQRLAPLQAEIENARTAARQLAESPPDVVDHATMTRDGFTSMASVFEGLQQQWQPRLAGPVQEVRQHAEAIDPNVPLLEQRDHVQQFFAQSSQVLDRMIGS